MKENIKIIGCVLAVVLCFVICITIGVIDTHTNDYVTEYPEGCEYYTHNIYKTEDGTMLTKIFEEGESRVVVVTDEVFSVMMKYDVDFVTANDIAN